MTNLYEILEVSEKASKEVIEKAYRVLAKKYHPDLQEENDKQKTENKMKQINEAYEILSNEEKRREYDISLEQEREEQKRRQKIEEQVYRKEIDHNRQNNKQEAQHINPYMRDKQEEYQNREKMQQEINRAYAQAYNNYLRSLRL